MRNVISVVSILLCISTTAFASIITYDSKATLVDAVGSSLVTQDWSSYAANTLLDNRVVDGIEYQSTSGESLVVGSPHGASWLLGYSREDNRYASFSSETISFTFEDNVKAFGIALSQGNSSQSDSYTGYSLWSITVNDLYSYSARANYVQGDFSGETFIGINGLESAKHFDITRMYSTAPIVWDIREIDYSSAAPVPEPGTIALLGLGMAGLAMYGKRRRTNRHNL
jgi:hypothetical protein